ncbi:MAG: methyltransferase domain-containing protein [Angustibacter sp.]
MTGPVSAGVPAPVTGPVPAGALARPVGFYEMALGGSRVQLVARGDGRVPLQVPLPATRWTSPADAVDLAVLDRCEDPVLDVGCGPGRMSAALATAGREALGVDVAADAVAVARAGGADAVRASVFDPLPGAGQWGTVLLVDGNVGIGGDPQALLARVRQLLRPGGLVVVEPEPVAVDERVHLCLSTGEGQLSSGFDWARLGVAAAREQLRAAGFTVAEQWWDGARPFLAARAPGAGLRPNAVPDGLGGGASCAP